MNDRRHFAVAGILTGLLLVLAAGGAIAALNPQAIEGPVGPVLALKSADSLPSFEAYWTDVDLSRQEDADRSAQGLPPRFALPEAVAITPQDGGFWQELDEEYLLWRMRLDAPGALSINLGFSEFELPRGARLSIYPADFQGLDDARGVRVFTELDNRPDKTLWTPLVQSDAVVVELLMPRSERGDYRLQIGSINKGYRTFGADKLDISLEKQGDCNIDVVCPEGDPWWDEINSVGVYTVNGTWFCSGAMINNTAEDGLPYFLTADHCGLSVSNDQGVVVYWNFQSANCGDLSGGSLAEFTIGSTFLANNAASDVALILLDNAPHPGLHVTFAGWDHSDATPISAVGIHHPGTDEKSISFEYNATSITGWYGTAVPGDGTHIRIQDWDLGTTEGGSSGSPLFDPNHRIVGQLHGGEAACGNDEPDWYGRFHTSWDFVATYLDPLDSGVMVLDTFVPDTTGLYVPSVETLAFGGDSGGPFDPTSISYSVENANGPALDYSVTADVTWLTITGGTGTLPGFGSTTVEFAVNAGANGLADGHYTGLVTFSNLTDGAGDTTRRVSLTVGVPHLAISLPLDTDPSWTAEGLWAFGAPTGGGGDHGSTDPVSGYTGANVFGYNLNGDYEANLIPKHVTSTALDCTGLQNVSVKFWRWLGVEQPLYDHASFSVSNDGVNFTEVWNNGSTVADSEWVQVEYDINAVAENQSTVYLRWTMGSTDGTWQYCGWNIDDVEIWGMTSSALAAGDAPAMRTNLSNHPNPFNPATRIVVDLANAGPVRLDVYDVQGRLVRRIHDGYLQAGQKSFDWDGRDDQGNRTGSGVYFGRLTSGDTELRHKMVLLK